MTVVLIAAWKLHFQMCSPQIRLAESSATKNFNKLLVESTSRKPERFFNTDQGKRRRAHQIERQPSNSRSSDSAARMRMQEAQATRGMVSDIVSYRFKDTFARHDNCLSTI